MPAKETYRITKRFVDSLEAPKTGQRLYCDSELRGFKLRHTAGGCKSYVVEGRVNGVNRRITIGKHGSITAELARRQAITLLAQMTVGDDPMLKRAEKKLSTLTLGDVLEHYFENRTLRKHTVESTRSILNRCVPDWLPIPIASITPQMIMDRHKSLPHCTPGGTKGEVQANMCMSIIRRLMNHAMDNFEKPDGTPVIPVNPVRRLHKNRAWYPEVPRRNVIPDHRLERWYQAVMSLEQETYRDFYLFLLLTGLRRGEASTLEWQDIDFEQGTLTIPATVTKNKVTHTIPLSDLVLALLRRRESHLKKSNFVFPNSCFTGPIYLSDRILAHLVHRTGYQFTLHDLRRTFVSMAAKLNVPHTHIKKLANHIGKSDVTADYIHFHPENLRHAAQQITDRFLDLMRAEKIQIVESKRPNPLVAPFITLQQVATDYQLNRRHSLNTQRFMASIMRTYLAGWLGKPVVEITREEIIQLYDEVLVRSEHQARRTIELLHTFLNFAMERYVGLDGSPILSGNPASGIEMRPRDDKRRKTFLPDSILPKWYRAVMALNNTAMRDYLIFVLLTGLRRGESSTLRWDDIDFDRRTIHIRRENAHNQREHELPLSEPLHQLLNARRSSATCPYVFAGGGGEIANFRGTINSLRAGCGRDFKIDDLRRTFYKAANSCGIDALTIERLKNHIAGNDIKAYYERGSIDELRDAMEHVNSYLLRRMLPEHKQNGEK